MKYGFVYFYQGIFHFCITTQSIARRMEEILREREIYSYRIMPDIEQDSFLMRDSDNFFYPDELPF